MRLISIISPLHNEEKNVGELCRRIKRAIESRLGSYSYEIILIDDASTDMTWQEIAAAHRADLSVIGIRLSYCIGQHPAIAVGLRYANGDFIVVIDGDLQDSPEAITDLVKKSESGFDAVYAKKFHERSPLMKSFFSFTFNITMKYLLGYRQLVNSTFCLITKQVADTIKNRSLMNRYFPVSVAAAANNVGFISTSRTQRLHGKSKYSFGAQLSLGLDALAASGNRTFKFIAICQAITITFVFIGLASIFSISFLMSVFFITVGIIGTITVALLNLELRKRVQRRITHKIAESVGLSII